MPLAMEVGLGPGNIVLNGDPAAPTERGAAQWRNRGGQLPPGAAVKGAQNSLAKTIL